MIRWSGRSNPQSSSSQRLKACTVAIVASMSCLRASSTPQAKVGSMNTVSRFCLSRTFTRASRFWYSGWFAMRSTFISEAGSTPSGISPRNSRSRQPGSMIGSNVGFGMKWLTVSTHHREGALAVGDHLHAAALELLGQVPGARIDRLVVVVVDVDGHVVQGHCSCPFKVLGSRVLGLAGSWAAAFRRNS